MLMPRSDFSSLGSSSNCFLNIKIFKLYIAFDINLASWKAPGYRNKIPQGGVSPRNISVNSSNSL